MGEHRGPWLVAMPRDAWLFAGTGSRVGKAVLDAGIEIDARRPELASRDAGHRGDPGSARPRLDGADDVLRNGARREGLLGRGVLAGGSIRQPAVARLLVNLWARMTVAAPRTDRPRLRQIAASARLYHSALTVV